MTSAFHDGPRLLLPQSVTPPDLLRTLVQQVVQQLIDAEFQQRVGAAPYERTETRRDVRNGSRPRRFTTRRRDDRPPHPARSARRVPAIALRPLPAQ